MVKLTYQDLLNDEEVVTYIKKADAQLEAMGYTEHGLRHVTWVAKRSKKELIQPESPSSSKTFIHCPFERPRKMNFSLGFV